MQVEIQLFGALREAEPDARLRLDVQGTRVSDLRDCVRAHAATAWPTALRTLVEQSAFASERSVLRDADPLPTDGAMALLPPVSGG